MTKVDPQPTSPDLLGDLLGPLAIEGPPGPAAQSEQNVVDGAPSAGDEAAIVPVEEQTNTVQVCLFFSVLACITYSCTAYDYEMAW